MEERGGIFSFTLVVIGGAAEGDLADMDSATTVIVTDEEFEDEPLSVHARALRVWWRWSDRPWLLGLLLLLCLLPMAAYIWVDLPNLSNAVLSLGFIAVGLVVARYFPQHRLIVAVLSTSASLRYMMWRATDSLGGQTWPDAIMGLLLFSAEAYAVIVLLTGYFQTAIFRRRQPVKIDPFDASLPHVDIFIPTYNEPLDVVGPTMLGAMAMEYANKTVYVLDDKRRDFISDFCDKVGATYLKRDNNNHAKAGNINAALSRTHGDLIAIFDADHVPVKTFLTETVGFFLEDERMALVQTPHHFYNPDPVQRNLDLDGIVPPEQHLFYHGVQIGNDFWNSAFFCGSCAVLRRSALEEVGGVAVETVTEDAHTALKMHSEGWNSAFLALPLAAGLATESFSAHIGQRIRWARGMAQIFMLDNPLLKRGLTLAQRINYFSASWHFFHGVPRLVFLIAPGMFLIFGVHPLYADVREVLLYALPHLILAGIGTGLTNRNVRHSFWPEVYEVAIAPYSAFVTTVAIFAPRWGTFNVTAKGTAFETWSFDWRAVRPHLAMMAFCILGMALIPARLGGSNIDVATVWVAVVWNIYNMVMLGTVLLSALERPQRRAHYRMSCALPARILAGEQVLTGQTRDISMGGLGVDLDEVPSELTGSVRVEVCYDDDWIALPCTMRHLSEDDRIAHLELDELSADELKSLSRVLFSDSQSWMHDQFTYDSPLRSALAVLTSPLMILTGGVWGRRLLLTGEERAPLVSSLEEDEDGDVQPLSFRPPEQSPRWMLTPALFLSMGLLLALGWQPALSLFQLYLPTQLAPGVTYIDRATELGQLYLKLRSEYRAVARRYRKGEPPPRDWSQRLFELRETYALERTDTAAELQTAQTLLDDVLFDMQLLANDILQQKGDEVVTLRLQQINKNLDQVAVELGR
ncbi:MAG: cellulose synthase (UDP-forming) [Myxococcota bacterium]|jgi:cellulose synthase (UDP-forming)